MKRHRITLALHAAIIVLIGANTWMVHANRALTLRLRAEAAEMQQVTAQMQRARAIFGAMIGAATKAGVRTGCDL